MSVYSGEAEHISRRARLRRSASTTTPIQEIMERGDASIVHGDDGVSITFCMRSPSSPTTSFQEQRERDGAGTCPRAGGRRQGRVPRLRLLGLLPGDASWAATTSTAASSWAPSISSSASASPSTRTAPSDPSCRRAGLRGTHASSRPAPAGSSSRAAAWPGRNARTGGRQQRTVRASSNFSAWVIDTAKSMLD
jgi:hypothetical protein